MTDEFKVGIHFKILEAMLYFHLKQIFSCKAIRVTCNKIKTGWLMQDLAAPFCAAQSLSLGLLKYLFTLSQNHILKFTLG